jgi:hypothetical protein
MSTDYRALGADIVRASDAVSHDAAASEGDFEAAIDNARAELAQPEPVAPTDENLMDMAEFYIEDNGLLGLHNAGEFARAVLARWGTPANNTREEN